MAQSWRKDAMTIAYNITDVEPKDFREAFQLLGNSTDWRHSIIAWAYDSFGLIVRDWRSGLIDIARYETAIEPSDWRDALRLLAEHEFKPSPFIAMFKGSEFLALNELSGYLVVLYEGELKRLVDANSMPVKDVNTNSIYVRG